MAIEDFKERREATRLEQQGDAAVLAGRSGTGFYQQAQRRLMPTGRTWTDRDEYDLRMTAFQRLQEKLWALGPDGCLQDESKRSLFWVPGSKTPQRQPVTPPPSGAYGAFVKSMEMDYDKWHDGVGYDLDTLSKLTPEECNSAALMLIAHLGTTGDWRELEALVRIGTPLALGAVRRAQETGPLRTRLYALRQLMAAGEKIDPDPLIAEAFAEGDLYGGLSTAIDLAAEYRRASLIPMLLARTLEGTPEARIHAAALAWFLAGKSDEPFDMSERPLFLCFGEEDKGVRRAAHAELTRRMGVKQKEKK
jgi:hypothetical protein